MEVKSETLRLSKNSTIEDMFKEFSIRSMPNAGPERFEITKNAFYMGVNATLSMLTNVESEKEFADRFKGVVDSFEMYNAELLGRQ